MCSYMLLVLQKSLTDEILLRLPRRLESRFSYEVGGKSLRNIMLDYVVSGNFRIVTGVRNYADI